MHKFILGKVTLDSRPAKNVDIKEFPDGSQEILLYRNVAEIEVEGETKYEAEAVKLLVSPIMKMTEDNFKTEQQINFYFNDEDEKQAQKDNLLNELNRIDLKTVRPLRAIQAGDGTEEDEAKLAELEAQATLIRKKIKDLGA